MFYPMPGRRIFPADKAPPFLFLSPSLRSSLVFPAGVLFRAPELDPAGRILRPR